MSVAEVAARFAELFGAPPSYLVRAPGRVNLIGEHTDYSLLPVLPIAIDRATWVAVRSTTDGRLVARSTTFAGEAQIDRAALDAPARVPWHRYLVGALRELGSTNPAAGAELMIAGDLPSQGGLSSSSSFTMGLLSALNATWELGLSTEELVQRAIVAERHVGVESGGMDQTVIGHAETNCALRIDFAPALRRAVPLPQDLGIVVAYSGEDAPKGGRVREAYNERVVGCRLAAARLCQLLGVAPSRRPAVLGDVAGHPDVEQGIAALPEIASAEQTATAVKVALDPLVTLTAGRFAEKRGVPIQRYARHVIAEARRVDLVEQALLDGDLPRFGQLLNQSHKSLRDDFQCSTGALDGTCTAMRAAGAFGARLTGAGFGGFSVAAVPLELSESIQGAALRFANGPVFAVRARSGVEVQPFPHQ